MMNLKKQMTTTSNKFDGTNKVKYITIHTTGNYDAGANAQMHADLLSGGNSRSASWHYTVDDKQAIQSLPDDVQAWHAGDGYGDGNTNSIGIEICVNDDGDYVQAVENAVKLTKSKMKQYNLGLERVKQHNHWSGKNCPRELRNARYGISWQDFLNLVNGEEVDMHGKSIEQLADEVIDGKHGHGKQRKKSLGSKYQEVQDVVNERLSGGKSIEKLAAEVIAGKHGHGQERKNSLGSQYDEVQEVVNKKLNGGGKTAEQLADEVELGMHGNGAERKRSLGSMYNDVQKILNRRY